MLAKRLILAHNENLLLSPPRPIINAPNCLLRQRGR